MEVVDMCLSFTLIIMLACACALMLSGTVWIIKKMKG